MNTSDAEREERIEMEIVVDAYGPEERALGWHTHLSDNILFAFDAECITNDSRSPLRVGEQVEVLEMADFNTCREDMYVRINWKDREFCIPLSQIKALDSDDETEEAIADWHYWKKCGYRF
jgi:hypothetical protein